MNVSITERVDTLYTMLDSPLKTTERLAIMIELMQILDMTTQRQDDLYLLMVQAQQLATLHHDDGVLMQTRYYLSRWHFFRGNTTETIAHASAAKSLARQLNDVVMEFRADMMIAGVYTQVGANTEALDLLMWFFKLDDNLNVKALRGTVHANISVVYIRLRQWENALHETLQALHYLPLLPPLERNKHIVNSYENLLYIYVNMSDPQRALEAAQATLEYFDSINAELTSAVLLMMGKAHQLLGDYEQARHYFDLSGRQESAVGQRGKMWEGLVEQSLGLLEVECGQPAQAEMHLHRALASFASVNAASEVVQTHNHLYRFYKQHGDLATALLHHEAYQEGTQKLFDDQADARLKIIQTLHEVDVTRVEKEAALQRNEALVRELEVREGLIADLDSYARTVAHDLKNPLGSIYTAAHFLVEYGADMPPEMLGRTLETMARSAERGLEIVDGLLEMARLRRESFQAVPVNMETVLADVTDRLHGMSEEYDARIVMPHPLPGAMGHEVWVQEVLTNLVSNAIKYGGRPPLVTVTAHAMETHIRYSVQDNGDGITEAERQRLFKAFARLDRHQVAIEGHGLGLNIVRVIVEKLGGHVWIESEGQPGRGSAFHFTLPRLPNL